MDSSGIVAYSLSLGSLKNAPRHLLHCLNNNVTLVRRQCDDNGDDDDNENDEDDEDGDDDGDND